ncbi:hypothetical protein SK128_005165 [Halocaridina rubra]|uniref:Cytochrome P450 n=1 Tax=Halocaridina rubra TaxID=373956 RepID=A0AAN9A723_HALRR
MPMIIYLLAAVAVLLTIWLWRREKKFQILSDAGIPVPPRHWLYGHLHLVNYCEGRPDPIQVKDEWLKKYGKVVGYYNGLIPNILISDLDLLRTILIKDFNTFTNRAFTSSTSNMLVSMRDQKWKDVRKIMTPVFSSAKMKIMMPLMEECVEVFLEKCNGFAESKEEFNAHFELQCLTLDVIDQCAMALDLQCIKNPMNPVIDRIRKFFNSPFPKIFEVVFTFPELSFTALLRKFSKFAVTQNFVIDRIHQSFLSLCAQNFSRVDALQMLMEASDPMSAGKTKLTEREVEENAFLFVLAGYETTSNALSYALHLLSVHPEVQDVIVKEIEETCGENLPTYDDLGKLIYTEAVICEAMRMYPPVPSFVTRVAASEVTYDNIKIPKGSFIEAAMWSIHNDEDTFPEPHVFKPERFLPDNKQDIHPMAFLPFGAGPRNCIGARFAMMESKLTLAAIVKTFIINPTPRTKDPLPTVTRRAIMNPKNGVWITLTKRQ